jgi:hypothetical protein
MATIYDALLSQRTFDFGESYKEISAPNNVITALNLFKDENLLSNVVLLDRLIDEQNRFNKENAPYVQSDFNVTTPRAYDTHTLELKVFKRLDKVTSRSLEEFRGFGTTTKATIDDVIAQFVIDHAMAEQNTLEAQFAEAVLGGKQSSVYASQGDLNFFDEFSKTRSTATFDFGSDANVLQQIDAVLRQIRQAAKPQIKNLNGIFCLCTGDYANQFSYHDSIKESVLWASAATGNGYLSELQTMLQAYPIHSMKGVTFVDVTGDPMLEKYIGSDGAVFIPRFGSTDVYKLYNGIGTMHATLGKELGRFRQYSTMDEFDFPTIISESAHLAINNLPNAVIYSGTAATV